MKLTKSQLKEIIKEEITHLKEYGVAGPAGTDQSVSAVAPRERSQTSTVGRASSLATRQTATEKVTDPVAASQLLFKQLQNFSDKLDKTMVMRNLIKLVRDSS
jgi:hypothetical protein|tara:strand:+ start:1359 stop:1667 length:309 start_codon:yes stop_codon:yes gene_type:complete